MSHSPVSDAEVAALADPESAFLKNIIRNAELLAEGVSWSGSERNCCFLNVGGGRFADVSAAAGLDAIQDSRSYAAVDWDHDGRLDLWLASRTGPRVRFLRNSADTGNHFLALRLVGNGKTTNRDAIGARVEVYLTGRESEVGGQKSGVGVQKLIKTVRAGEGFLSQSSKWLLFGLGRAEKIERVVVRWPGGKPQPFTGLAADRHYRLVQDAEAPTGWNPPERTLQLVASEPEAPSSSDTAAIWLPARVLVPQTHYKSLNGQDVPLVTDSGQPLLINLWATWCAPCRAELTEFAQHEDRLREAGLDILALSVDALGDSRGAADPAAVRAYLEKLGFPFTGAAATAPQVDKLQILLDFVLGMNRPLPVPASFLVDGKGRLAAIYKGRISVERLLADVAALRSQGAATVVRALPFAGRYSRLPTHTRPLPLVWKLAERGFLDDAVEVLKRDAAELARDFAFMDVVGVVANELFKRDDLAEAEVLFRLAIRQMPDEPHEPHAPTWLNLGQVLRKQNRLDEAEPLIRRSIELDSNFAKSHVALAELLYQTGRPDQAVASYRRAIELVPTDAAIQWNLGQLLCRQNRLDEAEPLIRRSVELAPNFARAHVALAELLYQTGRRGQAVGSYRRALELVPTDAAIQEKLSMVLAESEKTDEEIDTLREAVRAEPQNAELRAKLADMLLKLENTDEAIAQLGEAARLAPENTNYQFNLGKLYASRSEWGRAVEHLQSVVGRLPDDAEALLELGIALYETGDLAESVKHLSQAARLRPDDAELQVRLAVLYVRTGQLESANAYLVRALALKPDHAAAHHNLGMVLAHQQKLTDAEHHFRRVVELEPDFVDAQIKLGEVLQRGGQFAAASDEYRRVLALRPDVIPVRFNLALCLERLGEEKQAAGHYEAILKLNPDLAAAANNLAWIRATSPSDPMRDAADAVRWATKAAEATARKDVTVLATLAAAYAEAGRFDDAQATAAQAQQLAESSGRADLAKRIGEQSALYQKKQPLRSKADENIP